MSTPYKTVAFQTLGCKLNFAETSALARDFIKYGYARVDFNSPADVYVINTCSVTENANKKARKAVRRALRKSSDAKIAVTGCYAQLNPNEIAEIPGVSIVAGAEEKFNLADQIESNDLNGTTVILNSDIDSVKKFVPSYSMGERTRSFLKVQDGCDYSCSFCTIPLARGKSRSADISETIAQAREIANTEIKEIELTTTDIEHILCHVLETITVYEYPTPSVFSALTRLSIVSFLRGRGIHKDIELIAIDVFRQFSEFSNKHKNYMWFTDWSRKLVETVKEKKVEKE